MIMIIMIININDIIRIDIANHAEWVFMTR